MAPVQRFATKSNAAALNSLYLFGTSDGIYGNASYTCCKNIFLAWSLPPDWARRLRMESA